MGKYYKNKKFNKSNGVQSDGYQPKGDADVLNKSIDELQLGENTLAALKRGGVATIRDIACRRMRDMYRIQNIGKKQCMEILSKIKPLGIDFRLDETEQNAIGTQRDSKSIANKNNLNNGNSQKNNQPKGGAEKKLRKAMEGNKALNDSITKMYAGMTINEILMGKRTRPVAQPPAKQQLTPDSIVKFCRKGRWGYKDWKGNVLIQPAFDEAFQFSEGLACVEKDEKLGYINAQGEWAIECKFDSATSFSEGLASVTIGEKSGYIDTQGQWVIKPIYDIATPFVEGKAIVMQNSRWGVLSKDGDVFWR
ncbi:MAG: WG repeat-containing protein [Christensenellales bacterium]